MSEEVWHVPQPMPESDENIDQTVDDGLERGLPVRGGERAFKLSYVYSKRSWDKEIISVEIDPKPFAEGGMRTAHVMKIVGNATPFVAKSIKDKACATRKDYEADITMQALCQELANQYNSKSPPKQVRFIDTFLIERIEKPGRPLMACEPKLTGNYVKFNNNAGFVSDDDRNTPQAFSHFTYVASNKRYLIVDIQGLGDQHTPDVYTDPQIHAPLEPMAFGQGNLGQEGVDRFFRTHRCNAICVGLGLAHTQQDFVGTTMNPKFAPKAAAVTQFQKNDKVKVKRSNGQWSDASILEVTGTSYVTSYQDGSGTKEITFTQAAEYIRPS